MSRYKKYFLTLISITLPLIVGNISHILIGVVDVMVAAKHSTQTLAAISIANAILVCLLIMGIGLMSGITPVISNYLGANHSSKKYLLSTINYSLLLAAIFSAIGLAGIPLLEKIGFEKELLPMIKEYIIIVSLSNFGGFLHFALKEFLQAYEILVFPNILSVLAVFLNLFFDVAFVFGFWFIPSMGVKGLAIATFLVRTLMGLALLLYCFKSIDFKIKFDNKYIKSIVKVGFPISLALVFEFVAFNSITLIMGRISGLYAAAQSILINITSVTFMVPLAISNAIAIKVGFSNGAQNYPDIKRYSFAGTSMTFGFMLLCAVLLFLFNKEIISLYTSDAALIAISVPILYIAAIFQIFDGLQVAFSGILKGLKKTKLVTFSILFGYWFIGLPLGSFLAYKYDMKLFGFWVGLAIALCSVSIFMGTSIYFMFGKLRKMYAQ